jgi:hypothetical protein
MSAPQQTVYFYTPTSVGNLTTAVQTLNQNNNWSRGNPVSMELINTIAPYTSTGSIWAYQGPAQSVKVYKMLYYSTTSTETAVERFSATVYVPSVISTGTILTSILGFGLTVQETVSGWQYYGFGDSGLWEYVGLVAPTPALAALARGSPQGSYPVLGGGALFGIAGTNVTSPLMAAAYAGMVYVVPDGVGLGQSQNINPYTYFNVVYPAVDALRAIRTTIVNQPTLFNNFSFPSILPVYYVGYSRGGMFGPALANEFQSGVSPTLPSSEAALFKFEKLLLGATPNFYTRITEQVQTNLYLDSGVALAMMLAFSPLDSNANKYWNDHALQTIAPLFEYNDFTPALEFSNRLTEAIKYDTINYPPSSTGYGAWLQYTGTDGSRVDLRQFFNAKSLENTTIMGEYYIPNNGWTNNYRPLSKLKNIPVILMESLQDNLVCNLDTGFNSAYSLNIYMQTGISYAGTGSSSLYSVYYPGAGKTMYTGTINVSSGSFSSFISMQNQIATEARNIANNEFKHYTVNELYWDTTNYNPPQNAGTHGGFSDFAFTNIVKSVLTGQTIPT